MTVGYVGVREFRTGVLVGKKSKEYNDTYMGVVRIGWVYFRYADVSSDILEPFLFPTTTVHYHIF